MFIGLAFGSGEEHSCTRQGNYPLTLNCIVYEIAQPRCLVTRMALYFLGAIVSADSDLTSTDAADARLEHAQHTAAS